MRMISYRLMSAIIALCAAYMYMKTTDFIADDGENKEQLVLDAWKNIIRPAPVKITRVAVGVNANVDLIVHAVDLAKQLNWSPRENDDVDHQRLDTMVELKQALYYHLRRGSAAERTYTDPAGFIRLIDAATQLPRMEWSVGGNAALMAERIAKDFPGTEVHLIAPVGPRLLDMLYRGVVVPRWSHHPDDETHLILEYGVGDRYGSHVSTVANRFITSNDEANSIMSHLEAFFGSFKHFVPQFIILSGCHLLEVQEEVKWRERLSRMIEIMPAYIPKQSRIHLELASMANPIFVGEILEKVLPLVDSIGLNEQELSFAAFCGGGPHFDLIASGSTPPIHKVTDILLWLIKKYGYSAHNRESRLTRVHFHSLTFHVIVAFPYRWKNHRSAIAAGARIAGQLACNDAQVSAEFVQIRIPETFTFSSHEDYRERPVTFNASEPVMQFELAGYEFFLSPVLVCRDPQRTVGLGDAISSTALLYSNYWYPEFDDQISDYV